jgi:hypothetical protein
MMMAILISGSCTCKHVVPNPDRSSIEIINGMVGMEWAPLHFKGNALKWREAD